MQEVRRGAGAGVGWEPDRVAGNPGRPLTENEKVVHTWNCAPHPDVRRISHPGALRAVRPHRPHAQNGKAFFLLWNLGWKSGKLRRKDELGWEAGDGESERSWVWFQGVREGRVSSGAGGSWGHPPAAMAHLFILPVFAALLCVWALGAQQGMEQTWPRS